MPTLTIELPEDAYRAAIAFLPSERTRLVTTTFLAAGSVLPSEDEDPVTSADHIAAIGQAIAEEKAGLTLDGDAFMADLRQKRSRAKASGK